MRVNYPIELIEGLQDIETRLSTLIQAATELFAGTRAEVIDKLYAAKTKVEEIIKDAGEGSLIAVENMTKMHDFICPDRTLIALEDLIERVGDTSVPRSPEKLTEIVQNAINGAGFVREQELRQIAAQLRSLAALAQQCWVNEHGFKKEAKSPIDTLLGPQNETIKDGVLHAPIRAVAVLEGRRPEMFIQDEPG